MSINEASINSVRSIAPNNNQAQNMLAQQNSTNNVNNDENFWGEDGFSFGDLIDIINPLQHIPVIKDIYRDITGDEISTGSQMAGGTIYGGFIGLISSFVNSTIEQETGKSITGHAKTALGFGDDEPKIAVAKKEMPQVAQNITSNATTNNIAQSTRSVTNITAITIEPSATKASQPEIGLNKILADMEQQMKQTANQIRQFNEFHLPEPLQYKIERESNPDMYKQHKISLYQDQIEKVTHNKYIDSLKTNNVELSV